ncbi:glutamine amidotransferase-related protein, partial [Escherichia coli]|uniref:glutamine amidotransferase-related protein n=1 Tax=Escherichia coli TaxID=562 RepID=UPI003F798AEA
MILIIDNFDSFVHNLARYIGELGHERRTVRTDEISVAEALALEPLAILLSPGPCGPDKAGISVDLVR